MRKAFSTSSFSLQRKFLYAATSVLGLGLMAAAPARAVEFEYNGFTGNFDSTYTIGGAIRTSGRDPRLIGLVNGGSAFSINNDNGDLNFDKGDFTSLAARGINELRLEKDNFEFFARINYLYDYINNDKTLARTQLQSDAKDKAGLRFDLLDLLAKGMDLNEAFFRTLQVSGNAAVMTGLTLTIGVGTWIFSALQFQADMGLLLAFMFMAQYAGCHHPAARPRMFCHAR